MKNRSLSLVFGIVLCTTSILGCGSSAPGQPTTMAVVDSTAESETAEKVEEIEALPEDDGANLSEDDGVDLSENIADNDISTSTDMASTGGYVADFDIYKYYEPNEKVMNASLYDGMFVQIGDTVLELGTATLSDFVNAGVDLYNSKAELDEDHFGMPSRDKEENDKEFQKIIEKGQRDLVCFLSADLMINIYLSDGFLLTENDPSDPLVESISISPYGGNFGFPHEYFYGGSLYKDMNSIYVNGLRYTGLLSEIPDTIGEVKYDEKGYNDTLKTESRGMQFYGESLNPNFVNWMQVISSDDHCAEIVLGYRKY